MHFRFKPRRNPGSQSQHRSVNRTAVAQVVFKEEAPWFTIAHSVVFMPMRKNVKNYLIDPFGGHIFYGVDLQ